MRKQLLTLAVASLATLSAHAETELKTDKDKVSYGLGMMIGDRVLSNYGDVDYDLLLAGIKAQKSGDGTLITIEEAQAVLQEQQQREAAEKAAEAQKAGEAFLKENAAKEGVTVTDTGLQYEVLTQGDGPMPTLEDTVSVHYVGTLIDGREFDSSIARGEPASFPLKGVIPGWTEALQLMNVGSKNRLVIPSDLAYGERGAGELIGPGATLVFEVELLEIKQ
jgi:FKBP-type peptidyl-prolyl cis-trans isomerase